MYNLYRDKVIIISTVVAIASFQCRAVLKKNLTHLTYLYQNGKINLNYRPNFDKIA